MKVVIDIPEEEYNYVKTQVKFGITNPLKMRVANGTPLPKGHGRLIDADKFIKEVEKLPKEPNGYSKVYDEAGIIMMIESELTIIEADMVESEDKS
jgi:hypothetical protein